MTKRREIRQLCENFAACEKSDILHELIGPVHSLQQPLVVECLGDRQTSLREVSSQPETITEEQVLITIKRCCGLKVVKDCSFVPFHSSYINILLI